MRCITLHRSYVCGLLLFFSQPSALHTLTATARGSIQAATEVAASRPLSSPSHRTCTPSYATRQCENIASHCYRCYYYYRFYCRQQQTHCSRFCVCSIVSASVSGCACYRFTIVRSREYGIFNTETAIFTCNVSSEYTERVHSFV